MKKAKSKKPLKVIAKNKSNAKTKQGTEIKLKNFDKVAVVKGKVEKTLAMLIDKLFGLEKEIQKNVIPQMAQTLVLYLVSLKKKDIKAYNSQNLSTLKKYCFDLVGYERVTKLGIKLGNDSFEMQVGRAVKTALGMEAGYLKINKSIIQTKAGNIGDGKVKYQQQDGKVKEMKNPKPDEWQKARIKDIEDLFKSKILGQTSNKPNGNTKTPKGNKHKTVTIDQHLNETFKHLQNMNVLKDKKLAEITSGRKAKYKSIALSILRLFAKISVVNVEGTTITNTNEVQFTATTHLSETWARKHFATAIKNVASEPIAKAESK